MGSQRVDRGLLRKLLRRRDQNPPRELPQGPVRMQLCFTVGPTRNWLNLWKPTIDAMGQILGHASAARSWSPLNGRMVDLGLHCRVKPSVGNDVIIAIAATRSRPGVTRVGPREPLQSLRVALRCSRPRVRAGRRGLGTADGRRSAG